MIIYAIISILISIAVNNRRDISIIFNRIITFTVFYSLLLSININSLVNGIVLFNGFFSLENYGILFINFILILTILILLITSFYPRKFLGKKYKDNNIFNTLLLNKNSEQFRIIEYPLIILFCISGTIFLISSLYLISAIYRNSEYSVGASLMYFLLGSLSSCIILLGISLLYINIGNTNLENIFVINSISTNYNIISENVLFNFINIQYVYIQTAFLIMSVGFMFKISAAPFHF